MKIFMIGGAGLLGSAGARELIARGHEVSSVALRPRPESDILPPEMKTEYGNYLEMTDDELREKLKGCEGFVFAAGVDERVEGPAPIYDLYKKYNIDPVRRMLGILHKYLGCPDKKIITIPKWMFALGAGAIMMDYKRRGVQPGLHPVRLADIMCDNLYISGSEGAREIGVTADDIDAAIGESVMLCRDILESRAEAMDMKGE